MSLAIDQPPGQRVVIDDLISPRDGTGVGTACIIDLSFLSVTLPAPRSW
jgi:hypothetical protein